MCPEGPLSAGNDATCILYYSGPREWSLYEDIALAVVAPTFVLFRPHPGKAEAMERALAIAAVRSGEPASLLRFRSHEPRSEVEPDIVSKEGLQRVLHAALSREAGGFLLFLRAPCAYEWFDR